MLSVLSTARTFWMVLAARLIEPSLCNEAELLTMLLARVPRPSRSMLSLPRLYTSA
ncbi:hypothetical protein D3C81_1831460 [compost metagenome]